MTHVHPHVPFVKELYSQSSVSHNALSALFLLLDLKALHTE